MTLSFFVVPLHARACAWEGRELRIEEKGSIKKRKREEKGGKKMMIRPVTKKKRRSRRKKYWSYDPRLFYIVVVWFGVSNQEPMDRTIQDDDDDDDDDRKPTDRCFEQRWCTVYHTQRHFEKKAEEDL